MPSGKRSCLLSDSSLHSPIPHSHPSAIKQHSPARSQTECNTKQPHSPHFHSAGMGRSRVAQNLQVGHTEIKRVFCPSREGLKRGMSFIKCKTGIQARSQLKASLDLARSNGRKAAQDHTIIRTQSTSPNCTQGATAYPA